MKIQRYLLLLSIICLSFLLVKCGKDGAIGPQGSAGDKGAAGIQGPLGPAGPKGSDGSDGSIIYSGKITPATATGKAGDFYLNTSNGLLYGPKTAAGWGAGFSLKGSTGATGAAGAMGTAGSTTLSGAGLPAASLGKTGDYYLDKTNYLLYGPKTGSDWGVPINLQGPAGPRGPAGPQGPTGNANVKTDVFSVSNSAANNQFSYSGFAQSYELETGGSSGVLFPIQYYIRNNNTVTQDVLDNGMVLVYFTPSPTDHPDEWAPLPYQIPSINYVYNTHFVFLTAPGQVTVGFFFSKMTPGSFLPDIATYTVDITYKFKILVVTGKLISAIRQNHINVNNYNEIGRFLGIR